MYRQVRTTPRKQPRQARSKATVDTILEATARVLIKHGYDGLTTNAVAVAAGVSIGSLYQYFPNKEALVAGLIARHGDEMHASVEKELVRVAALPMKQAVRAMIELTIRAHAIEPELHRVLLEQVPRVGKMARVKELQMITMQLVANLLVARRNELAIGDPEIAAFLLVSAVEAVAHRAALFAPQHLQDPKLIDEATTMVTRYLGVSDA
jgi:AcrR family transcriptional regulator